MNQVERDRKAYALAEEFLLQVGVDGVTPELLDKYLHFSERRPRPDTVERIYMRILDSAQNANMKAGVIGGAIGGVSSLGSVLCDFQPAAVLQKYQAGWEQVLDEIVDHLRPTGKVRRTPRSIWPQYCRTILSAARFMEQFGDASEFYDWVDSCDQDLESRISLIKRLSNAIHGFGCALSCDFIKELGYTGFSKPDVYMVGFFKGLALCPSKADCYQVFRAIDRVARNVGVTPYNVDRLFWLIGSGYFYDDPQIGKNGRIGRHKKEFIAYARERLKVQP